MRVNAKQLELSSGIRRDRGEFLIDAGQYMPPPAIHKKGTLYIIAELEGSLPTSSDSLGEIQANEAELCHQTMMTILQEYYNFNSSATVTSALRHALEFGNQQVFNRNTAVLPPERRGIGVSCAVVRGQEVYLAQIPPTQAFLTHQGHLKCLPPPPEDLKISNLIPAASREPGVLPLPPNGRRSGAIISLGRYSSIEPGLSRHIFQDGDLLLLCSSALARSFFLEWGDSFFLEPDSSAALSQIDDFARKSKVTDGYVLAVSAQADYGEVQLPQISGEETQSSVPRSAAQSEGVAAAVSQLTTRFSALNRPRHTKRPTDEYIYEDKREARTSSAAADSGTHGQGWISTNPSQPSVLAKGGNSLEPVLDNPLPNDPWLGREEDPNQAPPFLRNREVPDERPLQPEAPRNYTYNNGFSSADHETFDAAKSTRPYSPPMMPSFSQDAVEVPVDPAPPHKAGTSEGFLGRNKGSKLPSTRLQTKPSQAGFMAGSEKANVGLSGDQRNSPPRGTRGSVGKRLLLIAALIVLLIVAALFLIFAVKGNSTSTKGHDLVLAAEQKRIQAQSLSGPDPAAARKLIEQAQADLVAATTQKADQAELVSEQRGLKTTLDNINRVVVPSDLRLAVDLTSQGTGVKVTQSVLSSAGDTLYLMDIGRNVIYAADLAGGIKTLLKTGDPAGGAVFGKPVALAARLDSVVIIDDQNISYIFNKAKGDWTSTKLGGASSWTKPVTHIATYQGNLYLLGPGGSQILRYTSGNYNGTPDEWVNPTLTDQLKLDQAGALAIDGNIYTAGNNGHIVQLGRPNGKSKGEVQADFDANQGSKLGPTLQNPLAMQVGAIEYPYIYVLDSQKRVIQFQKEGGNFIQQFQAGPAGKEFDNLHDFALDAPNNKMYLVGEQRVYLFQIPPETVGAIYGTVVSSSPAAGPSGTNPVSTSSSSIKILSGSPTPARPTAPATGASSAPKPTPTFNP